MSQIDFYVLNASGETARQQFACRLAEKAYRLENKVHIRVSDSQSVRILDDMLWTFRDGSFVPHEVVGSAADTPLAPVTISADTTLPVNADLLINLDSDALNDAGAFPRVAEVVTSDETSKTESRQRFVKYREQGHTLNTHKL